MPPVSISDDDKTVSMTPELYRYLVAQAEPPTEVQQRLVEHTHALGQVAEMRIPHEQSTFLTLLTQITGATLVVEVGTFTGYSTLAFALGLPPDGTVITCDLSAEWTGIARRAWQAAGVDERIQLRVGPATETLSALPEEESIDLVFLDADKVSYETYWDLLVPRTRPGGLLLADNVLYGGDAADPRCTGNARAIRRFNERVRADERVESVMLPIADGLTIARKRPATRSGPPPGGTS
ncbi:O-methyltransferase [Streptomyces griseobrunneus]